MLKLYDKTFSNLLGEGELKLVTEALVEEERNGLFELSFVMLNTDSLFKFIEKENIVVCNANDTLLNQKFRIYNTRKLMSNRVEVFARHISFDLMYDYIESLSFENQSCEYALNQLFRNSNFSQHYRGYSDIVNAQNYNISNVNILSAIGGTKGSIIDTFGNGAELLRDNENIHVLNRRGHDNSVVIEYRKNLTGFELEEDTTDLVTRILPYAKYTPEGGEEITVKANYVDSPLINNYSHPYIKIMDYSDKFKDNEVPTTAKLIQFAEKEYTINKVDIPKQNYKIEFIPLSKTVGYEALNDKISLCDTVTIKDTRYNIDTQSKVIRTVFNVLKNRYESIELGEARTSLGDIISNGSNDKVTEEEVKDIVNSTPSTNYPNTLPSVPVLEYFVYGFANIELRWTFENKVFYAYEVYASKTRDFTPNTFDLIYQGQASSYMFQAQPNETWYFKVCGINSYNKRTQFSNQVEVITTKISDLANYVDNMAIGEALIGELNLGRGWVGQLNANLLDVKGNFSVTDGNGKRTLDIDSFGNVFIDSPNINLTGATTIGNSTGDKIKINNADYEVYNGSTVKGFFGLRTLDDNMNIMRLVMSHNGLDKYINDYFTVNAYPSNNNPLITSSSYIDLGYRCQTYKQQNNWGDVSNIRMLSDGDIRVAPIKSLKIYTGFENGSYNGSDNERLIAEFGSSNDSNYDTYLDINAIRKTVGNVGLILAHYNDTGQSAFVRIGVDSTGFKAFRPLTMDGDISVGSTSYPFEKFTSTRGVYSSEGIYISEISTYSDELITADNVLDNINFISTYSADTNLIMDVTNIQDTNYIEKSEEGETYINTHEMLKLALKEIKQLKEEIRTMKEGV